MAGEIGQTERRVFTPFGERVIGLHNGDLPNRADMASRATLGFQKASPTRIASMQRLLTSASIGPPRGDDPRRRARCWVLWLRMPFDVLQSTRGTGCRPETETAEVFLYSVSLCRSCASDAAGPRRSKVTWARSSHRSSGPRNACVFNRNRLFGNRDAAWHLQDKAPSASPLPGAEAASRERRLSDNSDHLTRVAVVPVVRNDGY